MREQTEISETEIRGREEINTCKTGVKYRRERNVYELGKKGGERWIIEAKGSNRKGLLCELIHCSPPALVLM